MMTQMRTHSEGPERTDCPTSNRQQRSRAGVQCILRSRAQTQLETTEVVRRARTRLSHEASPIQTARYKATVNKGGRIQQKDVGGTATRRPQRNDFIQTDDTYRTNVLSGREVRIRHPVNEERRSRQTLVSLAW